MNGPFLNTHIYRYPSWVMAATSADKIENVLKHVELGSDHYALFLGNSWGPWKTHIDEDQAKPQESVQNLTPQITHTFSHRSLLQWGIQKLEKFHRFNDKLEYTSMCIIYLHIYISLYAYLNIKNNSINIKNAYHALMIRYLCGNSMPIQKIEKFHRFNDKLEYTYMCILLYIYMYVYIYIISLCLFKYQEQQY